MADVFQRLLAEPKRLEAKQYTTVGGRVSLCCPSCGSVDTIDAQTIDPSGSVARAWKCLTVTCGYREFVKLESWGAT